MSTTPEPCATAARPVAGWLRWRIGHHGARFCWWLYDRTLSVDEWGNRLNKWAYSGSRYAK